MARYYLIGLLALLAIAYIGIGFWMYNRMKHIIINEKPLIEEPVNDQVRTDKMGIGEIAVYSSLILVAVLIAFSIKMPGTGGAIIKKSIILPSVMALFNARKRTGKSLLALIIVFMLVLFTAMSYLIIGIPQKNPVLLINSTEIVMAETTVSELMNEGFDIYVRQKDKPDTDFDELISSGRFKKYTVDQSLYVKEGFRRNNKSFYNATYILAKDDAIIGVIGLYGHKSRETDLRDCKIIYFGMEEDFIKECKSSFISCKLNGLDLFSELTPETLQKIFEKKLWALPDDVIRPSYYGIKWESGSDHLFWNEYYSYIYVDENNSITSFELSTDVARAE